jgi:hypothetical protein
MLTEAKLLGFAETPGREVRFTKLGLLFHPAKREETRALFAVQIQKLGLFRHLLALLRCGEPLAEARALEELSAALPDENRSSCSTQRWFGDVTRASQVPL